MSDLFRLTGNERREINRVAQAIHNRYLVPDPTVIVDDPVQPRRHPVAGAARDHGRAAYADALEACRLLKVGRDEEAREIATRALGHRAALRTATKQLDSQARHDTGRFFRGEIFSVREYLPRPDGDKTKERPFLQWYFRLVLIWREDGTRLIVANTEQLEQLTGMDVGKPGWDALAAWIHEHSNPEGRARKGRPVADSGQLIFREREDSSTPLLRAFVRDRYPGLVTALSCLRRAMIYGDDVTPLDLPDDRPRPGLNQPDLDDPTVVDDRGRVLDVEEEEDDWT